jgi:hypothetical protein
MGDWSDPPRVRWRASIRPRADQTIPNALIGVLVVPATDEPWIRLLGMVLLVLSSRYYLVAARDELTAFIRVTVLGRLVMAVGVIVSLSVWQPWAAILFGLVDIASAMWTRAALRQDVCLLPATAPRRQQRAAS